jgi:hypothetical protein
MADAYDNRHDIHGECRKDHPDERIARLVGHQHGVIARRQLIEAGFGRGAIEHRLKTKRLHLVYSSVYAVGHRALTREARWMAAVLAPGVGTVLSHRAAGALWGIIESGFLEVTSPRQQRRRDGVRIHCSSLPADEITVRRGIPVTSVPRTLLDLASVLPKNKLELAFHEAEESLLTDSLSLPDLLARYPRRAGAPAIRVMLEEGIQITRSELEARFRTFVAEFGLPRPVFNQRLLVQGHSFECDCLWRPQRLVVELDGRAWHDTALAFERDRVRDRRLAAVGWRVIRVTWGQLRDEPRAIAADLSALLYPVVETAIAQTAAKGLSGSATGR